MVSLKAKALALLEVGAVFVLMLGLFRGVRSLTARTLPGATSSDFLFVPYAALLVAAGALYVVTVRVRHAADPPLPLRDQLVIAAYGFLPAFLLSVLLTWVDWRAWSGAIPVLAVEIGLIFLFAWLVRDKRPSPTIGMAGGLLLLPLTLQFSLWLGGVLTAVVYTYLFVALSEELLFRGYVQTRLNAAFGRPRQLLGISWGWGLLVAALFFGLWHLGAAPGTPVWPQALWTAGAGLFLGLVREKSGGVGAPALLHGVINYGPQAILFYLFWS